MASCAAPQRSLFTIYVLSLQGGFFYVGRVQGGAEEVQRRFEQHCSGSGEGAVWTRAHPPIGILEAREGTAEDEDAKVRELWGIHGEHCVRGGSYSQMELAPPSGRSAVRELEARGAQSACFKCGFKSHFAKKCRARKMVRVARPCSRCGHISHSEEQCYAKKSRCGQPLAARRVEPAAPGLTSSSHSES